MKLLLPLLTDVLAAARPAQWRARAVDRRRRARATVLGSVASLIALILILPPLVGGRPEVRDPTFYRMVEDFRRQRAAAGPDAVTVAFLGSSRTGHGVRPAIVEELVTARTGRPCVAYNLYILGNGPAGELIDARRLADRGMRPQALVLELTPLLCPRQGASPEPLALSSRLTPAEWDGLQQFGLPTEGGPNARNESLNPWFELRFQFLCRVCSKWLPPRLALAHHANLGESGWHSPEVASRDPHRWRTAQERNWPGWAECVRNASIEGPPANAFRQAVREAVGSGATVAVWVSPEAAAWRSWYSADQERELAAFLRELEGLGAAVAVDGRAWLPDEAFWDGHHCVRDWVPEYTRLVTERAVLPALERVGKRP